VTEHIVPNMYCLLGITRKNRTCGNVITICDVIDKNKTFSDMVLLEERPLYNEFDKILLFLNNFKHGIRKRVCLKRLCPNNFL